MTNQLSNKSYLLNEITSLIDRIRLNLIYTYLLFFIDSSLDFLAHIPFQSLRQQFETVQFLSHQDYQNLSLVSFNQFQHQNDFSQASFYSSNDFQLYYQFFHQYVSKSQTTYAQKLSLLMRGSTLLLHSKHLFEHLLLNGCAIFICIAFLLDLKKIQQFQTNLSLHKYQLDLLALHLHSETMHVQLFQQSHVQIFKLNQEISHEQWNVQVLVISKNSRYHALFQVYQISIWFS